MSKILINTAELVELAPVGGIAEYAFGLAGALLQAGHDVRVAMPAYAFALKREGLKPVNERLVVKLGFGHSVPIRVHEVGLECPAGSGKVLKVLLFEGHRHFAAATAPSHVYDWPDHEPFIVFSRAVVEYLISVQDQGNRTQWAPDVVHCQDAHTALIAVYMRQLREDREKRKHTNFADHARSVVTVHNVLNQGKGPESLVAYAGLPQRLFRDDFEFWGDANCFKAGIRAADMVNTVSRTYAAEIRGSNEFGFGLEGDFSVAHSQGRMVGIVNGIDEGRWALKGLRYDGSSTNDDLVRAKKDVRDRLFSVWQWADDRRPVIAFRSRFDEQKGIGLLAAAAEAISKRAKLVIVTWGPNIDADPVFKRLKQIAESQPDRIKVNPKELASPAQTSDHYAVADFLLVPSKYEPCGLTQMECQRFGTIPIVRRTGGLADTVSETKVDGFPSPNGYVFDEMSAVSMTEKVVRAIEDFQDATRLSELRKNVLLQTNGWPSRLAEYEVVYGIRSAEARPHE
jgi:starch synthase